MFFRLLLKGSAALIAFAMPYGLRAAAFSDIPGEGNLRCLPPACPDSRGTVTSTPANLITGSLSGAMPELQVSLTTSPLFLTFSGGGTVFGPLGLNPKYNPESNRDSRIPVSGQPIAMDITNKTGNAVAGVTFYLEIPQVEVVGPFPVQPDGISFGVWCNTGLAEPRNCANHIDLLMKPTGPGVLNPIDITPSAGPDSTFGDLLRFSGVNLAAGDTARFTFFITDRKATLDPSTGGSLEGASRMLNLEVVATPVPEPATLLLTGTALLLAFSMRYKGGRPSR